MFKKVKEQLEKIYKEKSEEILWIKKKTINIG